MKDRSRLRASLTPRGLADLLAGQMNNLFPDGQGADAADLMTAVPSALERLEHCFARIGNKYFFDGARPVFDHLHGDQYAMWLYFASHDGVASGVEALLDNETWPAGVELLANYAWPSTEGLWGTRLFMMAVPR